MSFARYDMTNVAPNAACSFLGYYVYYDVVHHVTSFFSLFSNRQHASKDFCDKFIKLLEFLKQKTFIRITTLIECTVIE